MPRLRSPLPVPAPGRSNCFGDCRPAAAPTLTLPLLNPVRLAQAGATADPGARGSAHRHPSPHSLLYKSDSRGLYLVVRSQWQLLKPLREDKVRVELLNDRGVRIDQLSQAAEKRQKCRQERCTLDLNGALRAPDDALDSAISCASASC